MPPKRARKAGKKPPARDDGKKDDDKKDDGKKDGKKDGKRKRDSDDDGSDATPAKKPKGYIISRANALGIKAEAAKGLTPGPGNTRKQCDDFLDAIEDAIRTLGLTKYKWDWPKGSKFGKLNIPEKKDETRWNKRKKAKLEESDEEIDEIQRIDLKDPVVITAERLKLLAQQLSRMIVERLMSRGIANPDDTPEPPFTPGGPLDEGTGDAAEKKKTEKEKKAAAAKAAAAAKKVKAAKPRSLEHQWNGHGKSLRQLLDVLDTHGKKATVSARSTLEEQCKKYGLATEGSDWDLQKRIMQYELASSQRRHGLPQHAIDALINSLDQIDAPEGEGEKDEEGREGDDDDDDDEEKVDKLAGARKRLKEKDKAKQKEKEKQKKAQAAKDKKKRTAAENKSLKKKTLQIGIGGWQQTFGQIDVSGTGYRCMWNAINLLWRGVELPRRNTFATELIPVRVRALWDAVMHPAAGTTNPARQARRTLYETFHNADPDPSDGFEARLRSLEWGEWYTN